jgi:hypothetical protein
MGIEIAEVHEDTVAQILCNEAVEARRFGDAFLISSPPPPADPQRMKHCYNCSRVVGTEVGFVLVRCSPLISWTRGSWSIVIGPGARFSEFSLLGPHAGGVLGASDASVISTLLRR